jgi:hypothetical protein
MEETTSCIKHNLVFVRNIYGDEINQVSTLTRTNRSEWRCTKCGKVKYKQYLVTTGEGVMLG